MHRPRPVSYTHLIGITAANLSILKTGKARAIRFETLNKLCEALQCQPGELVTYETEQEEVPQLG